jgi:hypothetical protein
MIKGKGDNMGKVEDMGVIGQGKEEITRDPRRIMQNVKMN